MNTFEITIQRLHNGIWPVVVRHQPDPAALTSWAHGVFDLDSKQLDELYHTDRQYSSLLGQNLFRAEVRDAFVRAVSRAKAAYEPLRVLLIVEAEDLRSRHWEQLCAPFEGGRWDYLLLNQQTPFSLYLPSQIERRFPPIGRRDLRALLLVAGPEELAGDYRLAPFDVSATVAALSSSLGAIPLDVLANLGEDIVGEPSLSSLCNRLTAIHYTLLFIVCHGAYRKEDGETILYFPENDRRRPVIASRLIEHFSRLASAHGLPYFTFLSTCESADPKAENGLGGLGQRLVRELGMPAVLAMTDRVSIQTAQNFTEALCARLVEHGEVDRALAEALAALQGRYDVTVPALFSRLGGRPLFSDALDRPLTASEIRYGLDQLSNVLKERAPILRDDFQSYSSQIQAGLDADPEALSAEARREFETSLAEVNQLCNQAMDISFNALALGQKPPDYDPRSPFPGLHPFRAKDREFFFGRQALVDELAARLTEDNFLAVLGPSGCGKSSLVLAGLIPALGAPMADLTPGSDPLVQFEAALVSAGPEDVLVVDQFEELFTLCRDEAQRRAFLERLFNTLGKRRVVITMRADFLGECAAYPQLGNSMAAHQALIGPMSAGDLRLAMERQADHVGLRFEAGLGEQIWDDVQGEPGAMPLLQHALLLLWQRRHGRWLRWVEYTAIGGIQQAIAHTAEEVFAGLSEAEKVRMRDIFIRLTRPPDIDRSPEGARYTRRRIKLVELVPAGSDRADTTILVNRLADARLVVTRQREDTGDEEVEVAHEALIQHWPRLLTWLDENRADILLREALTRAARDWESLDREESTLYRGARLAQANEWVNDHPADLNILEQEFLTASQELARREDVAREKQHQRELALMRRRAEDQARSAKRLRRLAIGLVGVLVVAVAIAFLAIRQSREATARQLAANGLVTFTQGDFHLATLLGLEANKLSSGAGDGLLSRVPYIAQYMERKIMTGHSSSVASVAWNIDGQRLASGSNDGTIIIWDTISGSAMTTLTRHSSWVTSVAWNIDGQRLASGSADGTVIIWDTNSGSAMTRLTGHSDWVTSVAWHPDGKRLASGSNDRTIIIWDTQSGDAATTLTGHSAAVNSVAWHPDGQRLASGSNDGTVIIWDTISSRAAAPNLTGHSSWVTSVAWHHDGQRLASGSNDGTVIIWDTNSGSAMTTLTGHSSWVTSVAWNIDGQRLASGSADSTVIIWDTNSGSAMTTLTGHSDWVTSVAWHIDGKRLASGSNDRTIIIWDTQSGDAATTLIGHSSWVRSMDWHPDGKLLASGAFGEIIIWDAERGEALTTLTGHSSWVTSLAWHPDGQRLASDSNESTIIIWDTSSGEVMTRLTGHSSWVRSMDWHPDGQLLASGSAAEVIIWDTTSGSAVTTLIGHSSWVRSIDWHPDGQRFASGSNDGTVIIWDTNSGLDVTILNGQSEWVTSLAWHPDGRRLASGLHDGTVMIWDTESREAVTTLTGHSAAVNSVAWHPDGKRLASGSNDSTIIIWDTDSGEVLTTLAGHSAAIYTVDWHPEGQRLASGSADGTIQLLPEEFTQHPCQWLISNLNIDQWLRYRGIALYKPTCDNAPVPKLFSISSIRSVNALRELLISFRSGNDLREFLLTVQGWFFLFGGAVSILVLNYLIVWAGFELIERIFRKWRRRLA